MAKTIFGTSQLLICYLIAVIAIYSKSSSIVITTQTGSKM